MRSNWIKLGSSQAGFEWGGDEIATTSGRRLTEAPLGEHNFKEIWWLEAGVIAARSVMRVKFAAGSATGFLISPDIVMTNNHVFEDSTDARHATLQFNYRQNSDGNSFERDDWECDPDSLFKTNPDLDYSICKVKPKDGKNAGDTWGHFDLRHGTRVMEGQRVNIIQHPQGRHQEIAFRDNQVKLVNDQILQYLTDTDYGTSGSPVMDDWFNVVALHNQRVEDPINPGRYHRNQGFNITAILENAGNAIP